MTQPSHRLCPVCGEAFFGGEPVLQCSGCHAVHHPACWIELDGCSTTSEHESQPLPRTFGGAPPPPPASRPASSPAPEPAPPAGAGPPPVEAPAAESPPVPVRQAVGRPRNIGSLALDARGPRPSARLIARFWYVPLGFLIAAAIAYGVYWGIDRLRGGDGDQPAVPAATATPTPAPTTPAPTPTPPPSTPTPVPTPTPTATQPTARFSAGEAAVIAGTDSCLNIRAQADIEAEVLDCLADGTAVTVLEGPVAQGSLNWWRVDGPEVSGWAAELYLARP